MKDEDELRNTKRLEPESKLVSEPAQQILDACIIVLAHPNTSQLGRRFTLSSGRTIIIGRSLDNEISFPEAQSLSRCHARLEHTGDAVLIEDLDSTNGTFVNDCRVKDIHRLRSGDRFQTGEIHFKFLHDADVEHAYHLTIYELIRRDGLTGVFNKRTFEEELLREVTRAKRYHRPLSLILFDIDHFKRVNDTYGHLCGDAVLKALAKRIKDSIRSIQIFARVGGEEFAVLCPETPLHEAAGIAERYRCLIESTSCHYNECSLNITCSFGVAELNHRVHNATQLYEQADNALYQSKQMGRNCVSMV